MPAVFFYRGIFKGAAQSIGIVGSRRCTSYGKQVAAEAAEYLSRQGLTVVSGLAKGIDSYAHTACLKAEGHTLAFVAHGPESCYPPEHQGLMNQIILNGAVISSFLPGTRPRPDYFPLRNQFLSAWIDQLLVVEAAERSGALITANYAMGYGLPVYAVPNSIYTPESKGTNRLLQNGAIDYLNPEQLAIKKVLSPEAAAIEDQTKDMRRIVNTSKHSMNERWILNQLEKPIKLADLQLNYPGDQSNFLTSLVQLELSGEIIMTGQWVKRT